MEYIELLHDFQQCLCILRGCFDAWQSITRKFFEPRMQMLETLLGKMTEPLAPGMTKMADMCQDAMGLCCPVHP